MTTSNVGCCGGMSQQAACAGLAIKDAGQVEAGTVRPGLIDRKVTLLISLGAAMAGNCEPCLRKLVPDLKEAGASDDEILGAISVGQMVKEKPMAIMKETVDELMGSSLSEESVTDACPGDVMEKDDKFRVMMLIAAASAMAANCEFCLNKIIPDLIEAGVSETDMRRAVEIGQAIKEKPATIMKEAADILTGGNLSGKPVSADCAPKGASQAGCCG